MLAGMVRLFTWLRMAGPTGAARSAGQILREQRRAERAVDALALRLPAAPDTSEVRAA
jgi:hypothetical protein